MIELRNISKLFVQGSRQTAALRDISLSVPVGTIMGVIGESGAGKSTLIRCINLLERPTSGEVYVNGVNLMTLSARELALARRGIGMIFQHFNLLSSRTVFGNIAFPLELSGTPRDAIEVRVRELLSLTGLEDKSSAYPAHLSGGQRQRVAIARALASAPSVLLCDEATSALDPSTTRSILNLLKDLTVRFHLTIVLITHEMEVVRAICDDVVVLSGGRVLSRGFTKSDLYPVI